MKLPFCRTGINLFGPIYVKQRRARLKRWGVLFTCFTTRAIHLEVVEGLDTESFISSLQRFMNRRGRPDEIFSDSGTNIKGTVQEFKIEARKFKGISADQSTTFNFNPTASPHMGGVWERGIKTVKGVIYIMIKSTVLTEFELCAILTEIEAIVNNRTLTHVSDIPDDFEVLTPNHFFLGRFNTTGAACEDADGDKSGRRKWKQVFSITMQFWKRWLSEYFPTLQQRNKWQTNQTNIKNRALEIVKEGNLPQGKWSLSRITNVLAWEDDIMRVVRVKIAEGEWLQPTVKVISLEYSLQ